MYLLRNTVTATTKIQLGISLGYPRTNQAQSSESSHAKAAYLVHVRDMVDLAARKFGRDTGEGGGRGGAVTLDGGLGDEGLELVRILHQRHLMVNPLLHPTTSYVRCWREEWQAGCYSEKSCT